MARERYRPNACFCRREHDGKRVCGRRVIRKNEQIWQRKYSAGIAVADRGADAIFRAVAAHGAVLLLFADVIFGVFFRAATCDVDGVRVRVSSDLDGFLEQHDAGTQGAEFAE